jgi:hypothetical protein
MLDRTTGTLSALASLLLAGSATAHGIVGQRSFVEPFVTEDVNPKNEFAIARPEYDWGRDDRAFAYGFGLEKTLSSDLSLTLDSTWLDVFPRGPEEKSQSGFDNLGITLKYAFFRNAPHEAIASFAVESTAPTGSADVGVERFWAFRPFFLYGKGLGDLPDALGFLRPFALQGDFGPEVSTDHEVTTGFVHDVALQYSVPYLQASVKDVGLRWPLANLVPIVEFNFEHVLQGEESGATSIVATPGLIYMDRWVELGVAGRFPLSQDARAEIDPGVIFIVDLFIDDLFPWTRGQPFGSMP